MLTLVTGATGLLGNNVVRALLQRDYPVRILVRQGCDPRPFEGLNVQIARGDICDLDQVHKAMDGVSAVIHCAAWVRIGWTGLDTARAVNVDGTQNVAQAALKFGARMVHVSTVNTLSIGSQDQPADEDMPPWGEVACPYIVTKCEGEQIVMSLVAKGLDAVVIHPGFILGPWDWKPSSGEMLLRMATKFTPMVPRGGCSVCDVRDVAEGIMAALERGKTGRHYILAGENLSYFQLARMCASLTGKNGPSRPAGPIFLLIIKMISAYSDVHTFLTGREGAFNSAAIRLSEQGHYYSSERAKAELNYNFRPAGEAVEAAWQWFQEHGYVRSP